MAGQGLVITKDTLTKGLKGWNTKLMDQTMLAVARGIEYIRTDMVSDPALIPVVTGRLKGSIAGYSKRALELGVVTGKNVVQTIDKDKDSINEIKREGNWVIGYIGTNVPYAWKVEMFSRQHAGFFTRGFTKASSGAITVIVNSLKKGK